VRFFTKLFSRDKSDAQDEIRVRDPGSLMTVLLVDDDEINIMVLTEILQNHYTVLSTTDSRRAVELARRHHPDVILLDIIMPNMDGYEVRSLLKNNAKTRKIPVIFITGMSSIAGSEEHIAKPFEPDKVLTTLAKVVS
jgi:CheY-like chemotaxis protein